jgi:ABC-type phosphate/phosphonate transport system substrate-binding protein
MVAALFTILGTLSPAQQAKRIDLLRIGSSGSFALNESGDKDETTLETMQNFVKIETGFDNEILRQKNWKELTAKLANGHLHLGVFQGYEFAWAQDKDRKLRPLTIAVNVRPYRYAHVLVRQDSEATNFEGLGGASLALPRIGQGHLRLFVWHHSQAKGKPLDAFFPKITAPDNIEDALDDVVDGIVQVAVVDRVGLEAYRRRKPGRFKRLKEVACSDALPPPLLACYEGSLDNSTLQRFRDGLLNAHHREEGQKLLNLFKLTSFETVPNDFDQVLAATRKTYPSTDLP